MLLRRGRETGVSVCEEEEKEAVPTEVEVIEMDGGRGGGLEFLLQTRKVFGQAKGKKSQKGNSERRPAHPSQGRIREKRRCQRGAGGMLWFARKEKKFF